MGLFWNRPRARHRRALTGLTLMTSLAALGVSGMVASALPAGAAEIHSPAPSGRAAPGIAGAPAISGTNDVLDSDSCPTATFCMAVGNYDLGSRVPGLSDVLSGGTWIAKPVPSPSRGPNVFANEVSCSSARNCLFVGEHWAGTDGNGVNLAEAWNGSRWHIVTSAGPAGSSFSGLDDVACPTSKFCLVIGFAGTSSTRFHDIAYTWTNGTKWRQISMPDPAGARNSELAGLACSDAAHCMAVGNYTSATGRYLPFAARWTSGHWRIQAVPGIAGQLQVNMNAVSCPTAGECVAVGWTVDNSKQEYYHAFADRWSGGAWHLSTLRKAASGFIGVSCPSAGRCFASGDTYPKVPGTADQLIETWNGHTWFYQQPDQFPWLGGDLMHVSCVSATFCEAVGYAYTPGLSNSDEAISEVWDGHQWLAQSTPNP